MKPIVVGLDGSELALNAGRLAVSLARANDAKLILAYVVPPIYLGVQGMALAVDAINEMKAHGAAVLSEAAKKLEVPDAERVVLEGSPPGQLAELAEQRNASMIAVGSHGRGPVMRALVGSVADRVVHIAGRPVLVVR